MEHLPPWLSLEQSADWMRAVVMFLVGIVVLRVTTASVDRAARARWTPQVAMLARRAVSLAGWTLLAASVLHQLGFNLGVLMGAAGVLTVAAGFAAQTAASNLISGLFLIGERPFVVGDVIIVDGVTGEVTDIDLVSVKLRTFDNLMVRVPNETLLKSRLTNLSHYPIRRMDVQIGVAYKEDVERVAEVLHRVADALPMCLDEPEPQLIHQGFGDSAVLLQFSVWAQRTSFLRARNALLIEIKKAFDEEGIEIPFPHRTLYAGSVTPPLPVYVVPDQS